MKIYRATNTLDGYLTDVDCTGDPSEADVMLVGGKKFDLAEFPKLKGVFKTGVGTDNLPFEEAKARGVEIRLPSAATCDIIYEETACFACHLILQGLYADAGDWAQWKKVDRPMLGRKKLLVVGTGKIGARVVAKMQPFMRVGTYDITADGPDSLEGAVREADAVSLHIPLNADTKGFFDGVKLRWMKDGALLVNTARAGIVDEEALREELQIGRLRAGFDVFWQEPYSGPLMEFVPGRFMVTPHVASTCREFLEGCAGDFTAFLQELSDS